MIVSATPSTSLTRVVVDTVWAVVLSSGVAVTLTYWPTASASDEAGGMTEFRKAEREEDAGRGREAVLV